MPFLAKFKRLILGQPLTNQDQCHELLPKWKALAILSSDALSSCAYATQEILIVLTMLAAASAQGALPREAITAWSVPIALSIAALIWIVTLSYRQTIDAYPQGGGAYSVAHEHLGQFAGLVAGAALLIDYVLTVSVSVAAGVDNIASAVPFFIHHKELAAGLVITILMVVNLRGIKESGTVFAIPTYWFMGTMAILLGIGFYKVGIDMGVVPSFGISPNIFPASTNNKLIPDSYAPIALIIILRAFSAGCTAMTGIEAVSNGIPMFQEPTQRNAKTTLVAMSLILTTFFLGLTSLTQVFNIVPSETETVISQLAHAIFGSSWLYYGFQTGVALVLFLAANTAYAGFPRLSSLLARDRFLPRQLASLGDRLVFSNGITGLSVAAFILIWIYSGDTHHLLPLYCVGVFLSFTLSQSGMVVSHVRGKKSGWQGRAVLNAVGAVITGLVLLVVATTRFAQGAWMVILLIPILVLIFIQIRRHYLLVGAELSLIGVAAPKRLEPYKHTVIVPISGIHRGVIEALRYALSISDDVRACYVEIDSVQTERMIEEWNKWAHEVPFVVLKSPYRSVITPLLEYVDDVEKSCHRDMITVLIPEFVTAKWWHQLLHNQTAFLIRTALLFRRGKVVTSVRYHLKST